MPYDDRSASRRSSSRRSQPTSSRQPSRRIPSSAGAPANHHRLRSGSKGPNLGRRRTITIGSQRYDAGRLGILAGAIVVLVLLVVLLGSCMRSCSSKGEVKATSATTDSVTTSANISTAMAERLKVRLEQEKQLQKIAKNVSKYSDESLIELALDEPEAIDFVAELPTADKTAKKYEDLVTQGSVPQLYNFDKRWGFTTYAGLPLGLTGSGPTALSMAYMGLTGKGDQTPADLAALAANGGYASGDAYTTTDYFAKVAPQIGLYAEVVKPSNDEITGSLKNAHPVICLVAANTFTAKPHYVICASLNENGTVNVYDPTSSLVTSHTWPVATIVSYTSDMFVMHPAADAPKTNTATTSTNGTASNSQATTQNGQTNQQTSGNATSTNNQNATSTSTNAEAATTKKN